MGSGSPGPKLSAGSGCLRPISTESAVHSGEFGPEPARPEYQKVLSAFTDQAHRTSGINCGRGCQAEMVIIIIIISPFCSMRSSFSSLARPVSTPKRDRAQAIVHICVSIINVRISSRVGSEPPMSVQKTCRYVVSKNKLKVLENSIGGVHEKQSNKSTNLHIL